MQLNSPSLVRRKVWRLLFALAMLLFISSCGGDACETANQIAEFIDNISDGAPCDEDYECLGGRCLKQGQGYPNGYCTTLACDQEGCSGLLSECFNTEIDNQSVAACYELCNIDGECDRASEGYRCLVLDDTAVCLPPGASNAPVQGAIGSPCSANPQCNGEGAVCLQNFFGGYCSILACDGSATCPDGEPCVLLNPEAEASAQKHACLQSCANDDECRFGYACQEFGGSQVCLEGERNTTKNPNGANDGEPCVANVNCKGGLCIREREGADGELAYPGGYCSQRDCEEDSDCSSGICISRDRTTVCMKQCMGDGDCRDGYTCKADQLGNNFCDSQNDAPIVPETDDGTVTSNEIKPTCSSNKTISFTVPEGSVGFFIAPYAKQNVKVTPTTLTLPDNSTLNIPRDYSFLAINPELLGSLAPLLFPATDNAPLRNRFVPGDYKLAVQTTASELCYYMIPQRAEGRTLKVNLYLVGVPGVTANSANNDRNIKSLVATMQRIYAKMGITVSVANYFDASASVKENYSIIRDFYDIYNLVATSTTPGSTNAEALSVNVFLINDFNISEAPGLLGVSTGIPGLAGLHSSSGSGLVFSSANLGKDNSALGQTMAHEIGHFLGLRHTTEHGGGEDPISDTDSCLNPNLGFICPDAANFMFPFSLGDDQYDTTSGQAFVLKRNPLVQP